MGSQNLPFELFPFTAPGSGSYLFLINSAMPKLRTVYTLQVQKRSG